MQMNKIIAIWGNPNSGKTTLSIKLATELSRKKKNVILILCDATTPTLTTILPFHEIKDQSLGELLSAAHITQESILQKCIPLKTNRNLTVLSYLHGENERTYAKYSKERIIDLFILLKHLADHIIIDCSSMLLNDILSRTAIELSDTVIRLISPDLKAISYFDSSLPLISDRKYNIEKHYKVLSRVQAESPSDMIANKFGGVATEIPYCQEIERQWMEAKLFDELVDKKSRIYTKEINVIATLLVEQEVEVAKVKKDKKPMVSIFKKRGEE